MKKQIIHVRMSAGGPITCWKGGENRLVVLTTSQTMGDYRRTLLDAPITVLIERRAKSKKGKK